jgi:hypothetical protein
MKSLHKIFGGCQVEALKLWLVKLLNLLRKMSKVSWHDVCLGLLVLYQTIELLYSWDNFSTCVHPMGSWLLVSYALVVLFRLIHVLALPDEEDYEHWFIKLFTIK